MSNYLRSLSAFGISGAHPGGFPLSEKIIGYETDWSGKKVLDAGCGTGQTASYLSKRFGSHVTGVDISPIMIEKAEERIAAEQSDVQLIQADICSLPFPDQSFDYILAESVTVFTDIDQALKEFRRVLKPNGVLLAIEMTMEQTLTPEEIKRVTSFYGIPNLPDEDIWRTKLKEAGFPDVTFLNDMTIYPDHDDYRAAAEFNMSDDVTPEMFDILYEHQEITKVVYPRLSYRILRAHV